MSTAFRYRVEFVFRDKQTKKERMLVADQWAYNAGDAYQQSIYTLMSSVGMNEDFVRILSIGPHPDVIAAQERTASRISDVLDSVLKGKAK